MAIQKVFSVFDSKAEAYLPPFQAHTEGIATRSFMAAARNTDHDFHRFAEDYTLYQLGTFDESAGRYDCFDSPKPILRAAAVQEINE